ncbi:MAG: hypothetical protein EOO22_08470 [Comamonadaceae bacterium]|nr:MAG: hypothetical protein EOO22_08470 [Comamonadaceae bacterium]
MTLSQHYHAAQSLTPKAARLAVRLLDSTADIPFEWRLSLRMALLERSRTARSFSTTDLAPLPTSDTDGREFVRPQDQARRFVLAVQDDSPRNH